MASTVANFEIELLLCERCLKCMADDRAQFEYARQSPTGKEHLKTCKADPKATTLDGTY